MGSSDMSRNREWGPPPDETLALPLLACDEFVEVGMSQCSSL